MSKADYLIIGQGLAGSCLALELLRRGKRVLVLDREDSHSASRVAAGMFNPITSKVRSLTWNAEVLFPHLTKFYTEAEHVTSSRFFYPLPIYRPFPSASDQVGWDHVSPEYLKAVHTRSAYGDFVRDPFGGIELSRSGHVDTRAFVMAVKNYLRSLGCLMEDHSPVNMDGQFLKFCRSIAGRVVFCEGVQVTVNPLFRWLPISKLKGEVLDVEVDLPKDVLFNRSVYLVPALNGFRAGSTYDRNVIEGNTDAGVNDIEVRLRQLLTRSFNTIAKDWGFRPVVRDRRPVIGAHPEEKDVFIFNGLGTKGVSLAPWSAACLAGWMEGTESLPEEVNISRFYPLYFKYLQDS